MPAAREVLAAFSPTDPNAGAVASLFSRIYDEADRLVVEVRASYYQAAVKIKASSTLWFAVTLTPPGAAAALANWVADIDNEGILDAEFRKLGAAIDLWAGAQLARARAAGDPALWDRWADNGKDLSSNAAYFAKVAWSDLGVVPLFVAVKDSARQLGQLLGTAVQPTEWPWWLKAGVGIAAAGVIYLYASPLLKVAGLAGMRRRRPRRWAPRR